MPATSSHSRMIRPPCTFPVLFASAIPIQRLRIELEAEGGRGSKRARRLLLARLDSRVKEDRHARPALAQGLEYLARTALERKNLAQTELQSRDQQVKELESQQEQLTANE